MKRRAQILSFSVALIAYSVGNSFSVAATPINPVTIDDLQSFSDNAKRSAQAAKPSTDKQFLINYQADLNLSYQLRLKNMGLVKQVNVDDIVSNFSQSPYLKDSKYLKNAITVINNGDRVVGAAAVDTQAYYPDCVAIQSDHGFFSGTLIAKNLILTAAHCHDPGSDYTVFLGYDATVPTAKFIIPGKNFYVHPQFSSTGLPKNDVALLYLGDNVLNITPRRLASPGDISNAKSATIVGFGYSDVHASIGEGVRRIGYAPTADAASHGADPATEIVVGKQLLNIDTCFGDSGGPVYVGDNSDPSDQCLAGSTSRAVPPIKGISNQQQTPCGNGGIYERTDAYAPWIRQMAAQLKCTLAN